MSARNKKKTPCNEKWAQKTYKIKHRRKKWMNSFQMKLKIDESEKSLFFSAPKLFGSRITSSHARRCQATKYYKSYFSLWWWLHEIFKCKWRSMNTQQAHTQRKRDVHARQTQDENSVVMVSVTNRFLLISCLFWQFFYYDFTKIVGRIFAFSSTSTKMKIGFYLLSVRCRSEDTSIEMNT